MNKYKTKEYTFPISCSCKCADTLCKIIFFFFFWNLFKLEVSCFVNIEKNILLINDLLTESMNIFL